MKLAAHKGVIGSHADIGFKSQLHHQNVIFFTYWVSLKKNKTSRMSRKKHKSKSLFINFIGWTDWNNGTSSFPLNHSLNLYLPDLFICFILDVLDFLLALQCR